MAENEPIGGGQEVPTHVAGSQPAAEPTTGSDGGAPPPAAPVRPRGLARWGVALPTLAVVGVVSVAAALLAGGAQGSAVRGWLPAGTVAYLELRADLPGDQRAKVGDILAKFPGFADQASPDARIDEALDRILEGSGTSWTQEVEPWLGEEIGLAVTAVAFDISTLPALDPSDLDGPDLGKAPDDGPLALVGVKDAAAAEAWIAEQVDGEQRTETYGGGEMTVVTGPLSSPMAYAVRGDVLLLGPEKAVKSALDTGGSSAVATSASFAAALETAPNAYVGFGYVDVAAYFDAALDAAGSEAGLPQACLDQAVAAVPDWFAGSLRAATDLLVFTATAPTAGDPPATTPSESAIAAHLPASTVVAVGIRDFGPGFGAGIDMLKEQLACDPSTAEMVDQLEQALAAIGGVDALLGWADDAALAVEFAAGKPGGGLAATVSDEAAADRAIDQVRALLALAPAESGITVREESYGGGELLVIEILPTDVQLAADEFPPLAVTAQGDIFVLGTLDFVKHVVDTEAGSSLASSATYERAISAAGGDGVSDVFVDVAGLRLAVESMIPADEKARYEAEVQPFLVPFEAFAVVVEAPGATTVSRAVVTFTK